ncbi:hypothetical protein MY3296_006778 [Beauveria thailandica]
MDVLKSACVKMNQVGMPIFFRCDIGQFTDKNLGMVDSDPFEYQIAINAIMLRMNKADRIMAGESVMTHAMVLKAVHLDEAAGRPVRCRFRNSWESAAGGNGWLLMVDAWMDEFVEKAAIDPRTTVPAGSARGFETGPRLIATMGLIMTQQHHNGGWYLIYSGFESTTPNRTPTKANRRTCARTHFAVGVVRARN